MEERADVLLKFRVLNDLQAEKDIMREAKLFKRLRSDFVVEIKGSCSLVIAMLLMSR